MNVDLSSMYEVTVLSSLGHTLIGMKSFISICLVHGFIMSSTLSMMACLSYPGGYTGFHFLATV